MRIRLSKLHAKTADRPGGYYEDVVKRGRIAGDYLELTSQTYAGLVRKYQTPWPMTPFGMVARGLRATLSKPSDLGVGDTIARVIGPIGGQAYKAWFEKTFGRDCGCTERQAILNAQFPYEKAP